MSIPTTDTPGAQLAVIAASAVSPSNDDPYPVLVGTATKRRVDQSGDGRRQGALHAGHDDQHVECSEVVGSVEQPMDTGDADVVDPADGVPQGHQRDGGLVRHDVVGRPRRDDAGPATARRDRVPDRGPSEDVRRPGTSANAAW
ncbi:MAG: hypothetical protein R2697_15865 [Ilumatobacteraceae bacterium]